MAKLKDLPYEKQQDQLDKAHRFLTFLQGMIVTDPDRRKFAGELLNHPYLNDAGAICDQQPGLRGPGRVDGNKFLRLEMDVGRHAMEKEEKVGGKKKKGGPDHRPGNFEEDMLV